LSIHQLGKKLKMKLLEKNCKLLFNLLKNGIKQRKR